jgi:hypothetical protein
LLARLLADHRGIRKNGHAAAQKRIAVSCAESTAEHACSAAAHASSDPAEERCRQGDLLRQRRQSAPPAAGHRPWAHYSFDQMPGMVAAAILPCMTAG